MIVNGSTVISDDIKENNFVCDLKKCKGACCVEGDLGAPVSEEEAHILEKIYPEIEPYLSSEGKESIIAQGTYVLDEQRELSTPTIGGRECAYAIYDENKVLKCAIEQAYFDGKVDFQKPVSCHLYPIRVTKYEEFEALNYDRWHVCASACDLGNSLKIPIYKFVKDALIRKYGEVWYDNLLHIIEGAEDE